jgi:hypothetical protein
MAHHHAYVLIEACLVSQPHIVVRRREALDASGVPLSYPPPNAMRARCWRSEL